MDVNSVLEILVLLVGFYMAWNIGANDVSNAMGTSVGSGALTLRRAVIVAAILEFSGAFFLGSNVSETMQQGIIDPAIFSGEPQILVIGMCAALCGTSLWLQVASYFGWPVSTTHAIVGAILGFGCIVGGIDAVHWGETGSIALSWVISPVISALISYSLFTLVQRNVLYAMDPIREAKRCIPLFAGIAIGTFTLSLIFNGLDRLDLHPSLATSFALALLIGAGCFLLAYVLLKRFALPSAAEGIRSPSRHLPHSVVSLDKAIKHLQRVQLASVADVRDRVSTLLDETRVLSKELRAETSFAERASEYHVVEKLFIPLQILSACFVAFAHGANDVANAIGPVAAVLQGLKQGSFNQVAQIPSWLLAFGGLGIVVGLATWGWRVIETIGKKITELTPTRGFCAEFGAALTILIASKLGIPVSTTHCLVGAVLGVGLARGLRALNLGILREIVISWVITIPASAAVSIALFYLFKYAIQNLF